MRASRPSRTSRRHLALILLALLPATPLLADPAYFEDFSSGAPSADWSGTNLTVSQATGSNTSWYLGPLNNDTVTLSLNNLNGINFDPLVTPNSQGQHTFTTVSFDLFIIGDWQGNNPSDPSSPNTFTISAASSGLPQTSLLTTNFSNALGAFQTYPYDSTNGLFSEPAGSGANQINTLGFTGNDPNYNDSVYSLAGGRNQSYTFNQSDDDLTLTFSAANLDPSASWGITNVSVVTGGIFTWQAAPSVGDGLDGGWDVSAHWQNPDGSTDNIPSANDAAVFNDTSGAYNVSIHQDYSVGFLRVTNTQSSTSGVMFNTIGHTLTITAGDPSNPSLAIANGDDLVASLTIFNSNDDPDSNFNGVVNAQDIGIGIGLGAQGTLTLDGNLDPNNPSSYGNVILNVQREITVGNGDYGGPVVATLNILHGAILNSGLAAGSASSDPGDGNAIGFAAYVDGTVNVDDQAAWNHTGNIWVGIFAAGALNVTNGSQVNIYQPPYAGQTPTATGTLSIGGFAGSSGIVTVSDPDSVLNAGFIQVGTTGVAGTLDIDNFGTVNGTYVSVGSYINGFSGPSGSALVNVTHQGVLNVTTSDGSGMLNVGDYFDGNLNLGFVSGNDGSLFNVGLATADSVIIGNASGVNGEIDVNYAQAANLHSLLTVNKTLIVGESGHGVLDMDGGGVTVVLGQGAGGGTIVTAGDQPGSYGLVTMGGGSGIPGPGGFSQGSTLDASAGGIVLGNSGFGRLEMIIGGEAFAQTVVMARNTGSSAEMLIQGSPDAIHQTFLKVSDFSNGLTVGQAGTTASIDIQQGGLLDTYRVTVGGQDDNLAAGSVSLEDAGSLWLVHAQNLGTFFGGGTLDVGGEGLSGQHGGTGLITANAGTQIGVEVALQIAKNGKVVLNGGSMTVGSVDPTIMSTVPNQLHIVGNTTLNLAQSKVYGQGEIDADVLLDNGGNIGPNGFIGGQAGTLTIVGSLHEISGGSMLFKLEGTAAGEYDTVALENPLLTGPAGDALLEDGAGITLIGEDYTTPQVGDFFDVVTAGTVDVGTLDVTFVDLPATGWYYGEVPIPGGEALRFEYGEPVSTPEPASLSLLVLGAAALTLRRRRLQLNPA